MSTGNCGIYPNALVIRLEKHVVTKNQDAMDINFLSTFSDVLFAWVDMKYPYKFMFGGQGSRAENSNSEVFTKLYAGKATNGRSLGLLDRNNFREQISW